MMYSSTTAPSGCSSAYAGETRSHAYTSAHHTRFAPVAIAAHVSAADPTTPANPSASTTGGTSWNSAGVTSSRGKIARPSAPKGIASRPPAKTFFPHPSTSSRSDVYMRVES